MDRIYFTDYEDMEKQTLSMLLSEPDGYVRDWITEILRAMEDRWLEDYDRGYAAAVTDIINVMRRQGKKTVSAAWIDKEFGE